MTKSINMVWGPHIARVKTKNILNLRIDLSKAPISYVPPLLGVSGGASFGTGFTLSEP